MLLAMLLCSAAASAQELRDRNYRLIGRIERDGTVRNEQYMMIGRFRPDGTIVDRTYMMVGKIGTDGVVRDRNYMMIGQGKAVPQCCHYQDDAWQHLF